MYIQYTAYMQVLGGTVLGGLAGPPGALAGGAASGVVGTAVEAGIADNHIKNKNVHDECAQ